MKPVKVPKVVGYNKPMGLSGAFYPHQRAVIIKHAEQGATRSPHAILQSGKAFRMYYGRAETPNLIQEINISMQ